MFPKRKRLEREGVLEVDLGDDRREEAYIIDRYLEVLVLLVKAPRYVVVVFLRFVGVAVNLLQLVRRRVAILLPYGHGEDLAEGQEQWASGVEGIGLKDNTTARRIAWCHRVTADRHYHIAVDVG